MLSYVPARLEQLGYPASTTLCATSLCGDEMNRPLEQGLASVFQETYFLGGLAGFPFGGITAFKKMKEHMPSNGSILIVYGPHVGLSSDGRIGHVDRKGIQATEGGHTLCCRSPILAANQVTQIHRGEAETLPMYPLDPSQYFVGAYLTMIDLSYVLLEAQTELSERIIQEGSQFGYPGDVAVLGGIQINTPPGYVDYFVPLRFDLYNAEGQNCESLFDNQ